MEEENLQERLKGVVGRDGSQPPAVLCAPEQRKAFSGQGLGERAGKAADAAAD